MNPGGFRRRRRHGFRSLQVRLLAWFLGAILLAVAASSIVTVLTNDDASEAPTRVVSRHVQQRVARLWDDPTATEAYVAELRDATGLDLRVRRDPGVFAGGRTRPNGMVFEDGIAFIPVTKRGTVVGAIELRTGSTRPQGWRIVGAAFAALLAVGFIARRVSMRLARPIEHVAAAAERFGAGDLSARAGVDRMPKRWVAGEVRDLGRAFDLMAEKISRVVVEQRELLAAISHELRSPMGRARVALEIARERTVGTGASRTLDDLERQLVEMDAILGDLLASARAGLADLRTEPVALGAWLGERTRHETEPVEVVVETEARVAIDSALLGRALHNVLANARAHGHPVGEPVVVTMSVLESSRVRVAVRDHGRGFPDEILARAFEPFVTAGDTSRSFNPTKGARGIGLGLALVRRIVEAHGGSVTAENIAPGAVVAFELPRTDVAR